MNQTFRIEGTLPGLNEYTRANRGKDYHAGARMKKQTENMIIVFIRAARLLPVQTRVRIRYRWIDANRKRDLDNIAFAKKFVQDALVKAGTLAGDSREYIVGFEDSFAIDKARPGVEVTIEEVDP